MKPASADRRAISRRPLPFVSAGDFSFRSARFVLGSWLLVSLAPAAVVAAEIELSPPALILERLAAAVNRRHSIGKALVVSRFDRSPAPAWQVEAGDTRSEPGVVVVRHTSGEHANFVLQRPFGDVLICFTFAFRTASRIGLLVDDHTGAHSGYFSLQPHMINLPVKKPGPHATSAYQERAVVLDPHQIHTAWVLLIGNTMVAMIGNEPPLAGVRQNLALGKSKLKLEVYDGEAAFASFQMWGVNPVSVVNDPERKRAAADR